MLDHEKAPSFTLNSSSSSSEVSFNEILENILNKRNQVPIESDKVDLVECKSILFNILRLVSQDLDCFTTVVQAADSIIDKDWIGSNSLKSEIKLFFKELIDSSSRRAAIIQEDLKQREKLESTITSLNNEISKNIEKQSQDDHLIKKLINDKSQDVDLILKLEETIHSLHYENTLQKEQKCTPECLQIKNTFITTSERLENALLGEKTWRNKYQEQFNLIKTYSDRIKEIEPLLDFYKNNLDDANSKYSIYKENQQLVNENNVNIIASLKQTIENHIITQETISNNLNDLELELKATRDRYDVDVMILNNKIESLIEQQVKYAIESQRSDEEWDNLTNIIKSANDKLQNAFDEINRKDSILVSVTSRNQSYNQELNLFKKESAILKESIESQRVELVRREIYIKDLKTRLKNTELNVSELDKKLKQAISTKNVKENMLKELRSRLTISETKSAYYDSKQAEFDNQVNLQKVFKADVARYQVLATTWKDRVEAILLEFSEFKKSHLDCVSSKKHSISLQKIQKISKDYDQITITKNKLEDRIKVLQDCLLKLVESTVSRVKPDFNVKTRSEEIARTFLGVGLDEAVGINPQSIMSSLKEILASDIIMLPQFTRELIQ